MARFTNTSGGLRGVLMKDGETIWVEAGASAEIDEKQIAAPNPDVVSKAKAAE